MTTLFILLSSTAVEDFVSGCISVLLFLLIFGGIPFLIGVFKRDKNKEIWQEMKKGK